MSVASCDAQSLPLLQQLTRGDPSDGDALHPLSALAAAGRRSVSVFGGPSSTQNACDAGSVLLFVVGMAAANIMGCGNRAVQSFCIRWSIVNRGHLDVQTSRLRPLSTLHQMRRPCHVGATYTDCHKCIDAGIKPHHPLSARQQVLCGLRGYQTACEPAGPIGAMVRLAPDDRSPSPERKERSGPGTLARRALPGLFPGWHPTARRPT